MSKETYDMFRRHGMLNSRSFLTYGRSLLTYGRSLLTYGRSLLTYSGSPSTAPHGRKLCVGEMVGGVREGTVCFHAVMGLF